MFTSACLIVTFGWCTQSQANAVQGEQGWQCGGGFNTTTYWFELGSGKCIEKLHSLPSSDQTSYKCDVLADTSNINWDVLCTNKIGNTH
ncbi:MAG: hypothetical protein JSR85_05860 [Proteobacteria bacterium]|nr:hypothetical protein [Pseudomonadota bacterium]